MKNNTLGPGRTSVETIFGIEINERDEPRFYSTMFEYRYPGLLLLDYPYMKASPKDIESGTQEPVIYVETVKTLYPERGDERRKEYWYELGEIGFWEDSDWDEEGNVIDSTWTLSEYAF